MFFWFVSLAGFLAKRHGVIGFPGLRYEDRGNNPVRKIRCTMRSILAVLLWCSAFSAAGAQALTPQAPIPQAPASSDAVARGKALTEAADCAGCHTTDPAKPFAGGKHFNSQFGAIYSPNLTPDRDTGIGGWSDDEFYRALHEGIAPDGSHYYPVFPYPNFTRMTRDDVLAIRAYLATLKPMRNTPPPPQLRWPYKYRVLMRAWDWLFFHPRTFTPNPAKSAEWNRGAYLVRGAAHCGACHTPKNWLGALRRGHAYTGSPVAGWYAPRLDGAARSGLKSWSVDDLVEYLQSGRNDHSNADGPMADVVVNSTSKMSDADVHAMAVFLKDLPARTPEPAVSPPSQAQMDNGEKIYKGTCVACHEIDGGGSPRIYPPLPGNANLQSVDPLSTLRIILDGAETLTTPRAPNGASMPAYAGKLSDQDIADVATYIRNAWGNAAPAVSADEVAKARNKAHGKSRNPPTG
jgi:mono/diheme cytochrome c family protein